VVTFISRTDRDDFATLAGMITDGRMRVVVDRTYPLVDAAEAIRYVGTGRARAKVLISLP
jgi:NADPH:quinone reductase-like Zn-dependent oxidoreductase